MIRAVTLDWGDTLATNHGQPYAYLHRRALQQLADELRAAGARLSDEWVDTCHTVLHREWRMTALPEHNPEHREFDMLAIFEGWVGGLRDQVGGPVIERALDRFSATCIDNVCAYDGVTEALRQLKARDLRLGILSHIPWHRAACEGWLARRGWLDSFDFLSLSSEVGYIKPHPAHYQHAVDAAGCAANEILHVGDHPYRDVEGGRAFGFQVCLRRTEGIYPEAVLDACSPHYEIAHVAELPALIDRLNG